MKFLKNDNRPNFQLVCQSSFKSAHKGKKYDRSETFFRSKTKHLYVSNGAGDFDLKTKNVGTHGGINKYLDTIFYDFKFRLNIFNLFVQKNWIFFLPFI